MLDFIADVLAAVSMGEWVGIAVGSLLLGAGGTWLVSVLWNKTWYEKCWEAFFIVALLQTGIVACCFGLRTGAANLSQLKAGDVVSAAQGEFYVQNKKFYKEQCKRNGNVSFKDFAALFVNDPTWKIPYYGHVRVNAAEPYAEKLYEQCFQRAFGKKVNDHLAIPYKLQGWLNLSSRTSEPLSSKLDGIQLRDLKTFFVLWHYHYAKKQNEQRLAELPDAVKLYGLLLYLAVMAGVSVFAYKDIYNPPIRSIIVTNTEDEEDDEE